MPLVRVPVSDRSAMYTTYGPGCFIEDDTRLHDLSRDPKQAEPLGDPALEARLAARMAELMRGLDAPEEAFARLELARTPEVA